MIKRAIRWTSSFHGTGFALPAPDLTPVELPLQREADDAEIEQPVDDLVGSPEG